MKKIKIILFIVLCFSTTLFAELNTNVFTTIRLENGKDTPWDKLTFGIAPKGTDKMDSLYGEFEIPNWPFPAGVFCAVFMTYSPEEKQDLWSYSCIFGPHQDSVKFYKKFRFRVFYGNSNYVTMKWSKLPKYIDSAKIWDSGGGYYLKVNMKDSLQKTCYETLLEEFDIFVHYNTDVNSITYVEDNDINIYPNPGKDFIYLTNNEEIRSYVITDEFGKVTKEDANYEGKPIDLSLLPSGMYFIQLRNNEGNFFVKKIIISK
jgi:hypothetical protein